MSGSDRQHSQPLWLLAVLVLGFASVAGCGNCKAPLSRANPSVSQSDAKLSYSRFIEQNDRKRYSERIDARGCMRRRGRQYHGWLWRSSPRGT